MISIAQVDYVLCRDTGQPSVDDLTQLKEWGFEIVTYAVGDIQHNKTIDQFIDAINADQLTGNERGFLFI